MIVRAIAFALVTALVLTGCVSSDLSYGPIGGPERRLYGYSEFRRPEGDFAVTIAYKATPDALSTLHTYFDRRADELCAGPPLKKSVLLAERLNLIVPDGNYQANEQRGTSVVLEGVVVCAKAAATLGDAAAPVVAPPQE